MANCEEFYCNHCKCETVFYLQSDLLWYCDQCGNVLDSKPIENEEDELEFYEDGTEIIRCPECGNLLDLNELEGDCLCPICYEDMESEIEKRGFVFDNTLERYVRI